MTDDLTTFCHHVVWYHEPLTLYAHLNGREVVYCANGGTPGKVEDMINVVYVHGDCLPNMHDMWWADGVCIDRPSLAAYLNHACAVCGEVVPDKYQLELYRR